MRTKYYILTLLILTGYGLKVNAQKVTLDYYFNLRGYIKPHRGPDRALSLYLGRQS